MGGCHSSLNKVMKAYQAFLVVAYSNNSVTRVVGLMNDDLILQLVGLKSNSIQ